MCTFVKNSIMRIYLVGFMGCGKSSLGKRLARKLEYDFLDLDQEIEKQTGKTITEIFRHEGEDWFRRKEKEVLHKTISMERLVISTGGGTPYHFDNMEFMNAHGVTVYLKMSPVSLTHRLENARRKRPLVADLEGGDLQRFVKDRLEQREPFYTKAHCIIKGESVKPSQIEKLIFGS